MPERVLKKIGKYHILEKVGQGRMGVVFHARDPLIEREVAIKVIRMDMLRDSHRQEEAEKRFLTEARAVGKLLHPNIVTIFDVGRDQNLLYIAMEYLEGNDLRHYCRPEHRLSMRQILATLIGLCDALDYAHRRGTIHRDIKPGNIIRTTDGVVKVTDFGLAKLPASEVTRQGVLLGSPGYMAPEQIAGQQVDGRADIFAVGVVMYELIMSEQPFAGKDVYSTMYRISYEEPDRMDEFRRSTPPGLDRVLLKALAKKPDDRYPAAMAMAKDLKHIMRIATQRMSASRLTGASAPISAVHEDTEPQHTVLLSPEEIQRLLARRILVVRLQLTPNGVAVGVSEAVEGEAEAPAHEICPVQTKELRVFAESSRDILAEERSDHSGIARLQEMGFRMHQRLFGFAARKTLAASGAEDLLLYVEDRLAGIHWELLHDGHDFLCMLYNMARWPADLPGSRMRAVSPGSRRVLIIANPRSDSAPSQEEGKRLAHAFASEPGRVKAIVWDKNITSSKLRRMGAVDILHYAGPIQYITKEPGSSGWVLKNGLIPWNSAWEKTRIPDLIFAHCWGWEPQGGRRIYSPRQVAAFARPLLEKRGGCYVGTLHCADERLSASFVEPFYHELLHGATAGQSVRRARLSLMNQTGEECLLWSGYILYGMPTQRLFPPEGV